MDGDHCSAGSRESLLDDKPSGRLRPGALRRSLSLLLNRTHKGVPTPAWGDARQERRRLVNGIVAFCAVLCVPTKVRIERLTYMEQGRAGALLLRPFAYIQLHNASSWTSSFGLDIFPTHPSPPLSLCAGPCYRTHPLSLQRSPAQKTQHKALRAL